MNSVNDVIKRAAELSKSRAKAQQSTPKQASDEKKYTLAEALEVFVKGAQLAIAEQEAAKNAEASDASDDEKAVMYARDLLKAAAELNN